MIGWSWVLLTGGWITNAGSFGAMLAFALGGGAMVFVALTYAELASALPDAGGEHVYSLRAFGPVGSFVCSWAIVLGYVAVAAFETVAFPYALSFLIPGTDLVELWTLHGFTVHASFVAIGLAGAWFFTVINIRGLSVAAGVQKAVTLVIVIVGVFLLIGAVKAGNATHLAPLWVNGAQGFAAVMIMVPIMFVGFDVIPQAAAEIDLPARSIGRLIVLSVGCAIVWYCAILWAVAYVLPAEIRAQPGMTTALASARAWGGQWAFNVLVIGGIAGILTTWNAFVVGASRLIFALAESDMLPRGLAALHPRYGTPHRALWAVGILTCLAPWFGRPILIWLLNAGSLAVIVGYILVVGSFLALRVREPELARPYRVRHWRTVGALALLLSLAITSLYLPGSAAALAPPEWLICGGWALGGLVLYRVSRS